jgi:DNA repair exonuclease SbcCD ATPase subunit
MYDFISRYHTATKEILRVINPEIKSLETRISDKKDTIETVTNNLFQYIEQKENEEAQRKEKISKLEKEYEELVNLDLDSEIKLRREIRELENKLRTEKNNLEKLNSDILNINSRLKSVKSSISDKEREINVTKENPERCPVCYNIIDEESLNKYLEDKNNEYNNLVNSKNELEQQFKTYNDEVANLESYIKDAETKLESKRSKCSSNLADEEIENSKVRLTGISSELKYLRENPIDVENDSLISSSTEDLEKHKKELKKHRKKLRKLEEEKDYYEWWKIALGNNPSSMKSFCINHVITSFNKYINYYLSFFGYDVTYSLNEELEETIMKDGYEATFGSFSGGEKRALEISLVFALYELIRLKLPDNINMIVLDELLSINFDDVRVSAAIDILTELEERGLSIFVIDHKSTLKDNLECKVINVVKDKHGNSRIETT